MLKTATVSDPAASAAPVVAVKEPAKAGSKATKMGTAATASGQPAALDVARMTDSIVAKVGLRCGVHVFRRFVHTSVDRQKKVTKVHTKQLADESSCMLCSASQSAVDSSQTLRPCGHSGQTCSWRSTR